MYRDNVEPSPLDPYHPLMNKHPLDLELIQSFQLKDPALLKAAEEDKHFFYLNIYNRELIVYAYPPTSNKTRIVIP